LIYNNKKILWHYMNDFGMIFNLNKSLGYALWHYNC
jgi:hypothetical protein